MPINYGSQIEEHHAVRRGAGMFDVSHMTVVDITGVGAKAFLRELLANDVDVVAVDEAQFFDMGLIEVCNSLANQGIRVVVAGLDMDFMGRPFGPIPGLIATAEYVTKVHAICVRCGYLAHHTHRKLKADKLVLLGEKDLYEPLCRKCYNVARTE